MRSSSLPQLFVFAEPPGLRSKSTLSVLKTCRRVGRETYSTRKAAQSPSPAQSVKRSWGTRFPRKPQCWRRQSLPFPRHGISSEPSVCPALPLHRRSRRCAPDPKFGRRGIHPARSRLPQSRAAGQVVLCFVHPPLRSRFLASEDSLQWSTRSLTHPSSLLLRHGFCCCCCSCHCCFRCHYGQVTCLILSPLLLLLRARRPLSPARWTSQLCLS
mmetsp:Transcript_82270/g.172245  ORF Transcript_82270/g.172245 Transcript_82270/m.172245 type:complete len:214 (+) Transcript_82270:226-867(+)